MGEFELEDEPEPQNRKDLIRSSREETSFRCESSLVSIKYP